MIHKVNGKRLVGMGVWVYYEAGTLCHFFWRE